MGDTRIEAARASLGRVGAHIPHIGIERLPSFAVQRDAIRRLEAAGYRAAWANEGVGGKDVFVQIASLLAVSERIVFGTDIANMFARAPQVTHAAAAQLADAHPGRFVLGLGAGYPFQADQVGRRYKPFSDLRDYLVKMREPAPLNQPPDADYICIIAANGPKMLDLAGSGADGAIPTVVPPAFIAQARAAIGPDRLLVVGMTEVLHEDRAIAKQKAKQMLSGALGFPGSPYAANLVRLGYSHDDVVSAADPVLDGVMAYGDVAAIADKVEEQLAAGADHLVLYPTSPDYDESVRQLEKIADRLTI